MDAHLSEIAGTAESTTWASMVVEPARPSRMWIAVGPPSQNPFEEVGLPTA
jgi:hypothetical protein